MAYALEKRLSEVCRSLGLKFEVCPDGTKPDDILPAVKAYGCAEELFDALEKRDPYELADTLVVLDVGMQLEEAFDPETPKADGWHRTNHRAGVAVELVLRFPQVFPVILSPAVPTSDEELKRDTNAEKTDTKVEVVDPSSRATKDNEWGRFHSLRNELFTKNKPGQPDLDFGNLLGSLRVPLNFVSPLDKGNGLSSTLARFAHGMRCWFDPTGLRTFVKNRFLGQLFGKDNNWNNTDDQRKVLLDRLSRVAVAIDEEREFALLNAYTAWKFGRRAWIVTTYSEFNTHPLWSVKSEKATDVVVLRDVDLRFPDVKVGGQNINVRGDLRNIRSDRWQDKIGKAWLVRVVSGETNVRPVASPDKLKACSPDLENWRLGQEGGTGKEEVLSYSGFSKPLATLYDLQDVLGEPGSRAESSVISRITQPSDSSDDGQQAGHGAPYSNLAIAESLLRQARCRQETFSESVIGALLASEAYELLLGMSKTTALEALYEMHRSEVRAEIGIPGTGEAISIKHRQEDVKKTVVSLYRKLGLKQSVRVQRLYLSQIWSELRVIYRKGEQFGAGEQANIEGLRYARWTPKWIRASMEWLLDRVGIRRLVAGIAGKTSGGVARMKKWVFSGVEWVGLNTLLLKVQTLLLKVQEHKFTRFFKGSWILARDRFRLENFKWVILKVCTTVTGWVVALFVFTVSFAGLYAWKAGLSWDLVHLDGYRRFGVLASQVLLATLQMQFNDLENEYKAVLDVDGIYVASVGYPVDGFWHHILAIAHLGVSFVMFGILIAMIYRKITRS